MNAIVAVSSNWGIGKGNDLLFHISDDMKRFRSLTSGGTVIMGRKTLDSMPGGKALPKRRNIVITRDVDFSRENVEVAHSIEEAIALASSDVSDKIWVIGGVLFIILSLVTSPVAGIFILIPMALAPVIYSFVYYLKYNKE